MFFRKLKTKLQERRGASITFALLLFLVCAVVGSVVLTAGTAAGGRVSLMTEQDQRYYAVSSAAGLFRDALDGQTWTVTRAETCLESVTTVSTLVNGQDPVIQTGPAAYVDGNTIYSATISSGGAPKEIASSDRSASILSEAILQYVFGTGEHFADSMGYVSVPGRGGLPSWTLTVAPAAGSTVDVITVEVTGEMRADGSIVFTFVNKAAAGEDTFTLQLTLTAVISDDSAAPKQTRTAVVPGDPNYVSPVSEDVVDGEGEVIGTRVTTVQRTHVVNAKTTSITWTAGDVRKVVTP